MIPLLTAAVSAVMLGCFLLVSGRTSPSVAWALVVAGAVLYYGIRGTQQWRTRRAEDRKRGLDDRDERPRLP